MTKWTTVLVLGVPAALIAVLGVEIAIVLADEYLVEAEFVVDQRVQPSGELAEKGQQDEVFRLWVLGDSTAAGVGANDESSSLPVQIAQRVSDASSRPVHVTGLGVSGARTADVIQEQSRMLPSSGLDAVVVVIGSNDVTHGTPPWTLARQTQEMIAALEAQTDAPIILGGIPRFYGVTALPQPLRAIVDGYGGVLRQRQMDNSKGATFVNIAELASPRFRGVPESMSSDDFHPAAVGYGFWADALAPPVTMLATG
jgi:lysophospholipase L1-like esterase